MMLVGGDRKVCRWLLNVGSCMLLADGTMLAGGGATRSRCPAQGILLGAGGSRGLSSGGGTIPLEQGVMANSECTVEMLSVGSSMPLTPGIMLEHGHTVRGGQGQHWVMAAVAVLLWWRGWVDLALLRGEESRLLRQQSRVVGEARWVGRRRRVNKRHQRERQEICYGQLPKWVRRGLQREARQRTARMRRQGRQERAREGRPRRGGGNQGRGRLGLHTGRVMMVVVFLMAVCLKAQGEDDDGGLVMQAAAACIGAATGIVGGIITGRKGPYESDDEGGGEESDQDEEDDCHDMSTWIGHVVVQRHADCGLRIGCVNVQKKLGSFEGRVSYIDKLVEVL